MTAIENLQQQFLNLTPTEQSKFRNWTSVVARRVVSGIEKTPGVCGGSARVAGTRIPIWSIIEYLQMGVGEQQILKNFPTLKATDLANAKNYYRSNKTEIDREIAENNED